LNCNFGKTRNNGICPHKSPSRPLAERLAELEALRAQARLVICFQTTNRGHVLKGHGFSRANTA
jgi:hypothetical protein